MDAEPVSEMRGNSRFRRHLAASALRCSERIRAGCEHPALLVFFLATGVRLAWIAYAGAPPAGDDTSAYDGYARALLDGDGYVGPDGEPTAFWTPGYPMVLALAYALPFANYETAHVLNAVAGGLGAALMVPLGAALANRAVGIVSGVIIALLPGAVYYSALLLSESVFLAFLVGTLVLYVRWADTSQAPRVRHMVLVGSLFGALTLIRGQSALLPLALAPLWLSKHRLSRASLAGGAALVVGISLVIVPWTVRNTIALGEPVLVSTGGSQTLWTGHHEGASGYIEIPYAHSAVFSDVPNPERELAVADAQRDEAFDYMLTQPLEELRLIPKKLRHLYGGDGAAIDWLQEHGARAWFSERGERLWELLADVAFYTVAAFAIVPFVNYFLSRRSWAVPSRLALPFLIVLYVTVMHGWLFYGEGRFHVMAYPALALLAAEGALVVWRSLPLQGAEP